jgi:hypothetical protein
VRWLEGEKDAGEEVKLGSRRRRHDEPRWVRQQGRLRTTDTLDDPLANRMDGDGYGRRRLSLEARDASHLVVCGMSKSSRRRGQRQHVVASAWRNQSWTASIDIM